MSSVEPCLTPPREVSNVAGSVSPWCLAVGKRLFDLCCSSLVLIVFLPVLLILGLLVKLTSSGPVLFRQARVGKDGKEFNLLKFRTMIHNRGQAGPSITRKGDGRVTALGRVLRKGKLDELPQFINVVLGEMSLVGPRPDLADFWAALSTEQRRVLCLLPGITGQASLQFRDEETMLCRVPTEQLTTYYVTSVLPEKVRLDWEYAQRATFSSDFKILLDTLRVI